jgi:glycosyltransferase involved in cell wall biosynthesis
MKLCCERPIVDVVLPVHNGAATLEDSIDSILTQTVSNIRVLIVDDGSVDGTPSILAAVAARDSRVLVLTKPNGGLVDALNLGLSHVSAPFIARQDADDRSFPDRFARQLAVLLSQPDVVAVSGSCIHIDETGHRTGTQYDAGDPRYAVVDSIPSIDPHLLHPFLMVRRESLERIGGYRYAFHAEDTDLYWRLRRLGRLCNLNPPLGEMRLHSKSISNASIVNGRIMAINFQLAAVSARRGDERCSDLLFPKHRLVMFTAAEKLEDMMAIAELELSDKERHHFRAATVVKLLELAATRYYELDANDCRFIRSVYLSFDPKSFLGRSTLSWAYRNTLSRLVRKRFFKEAGALASVRLLACITLMRFVPPQPATSPGPDKRAQRRSSAQG